MQLCYALRRGVYYPSQRDAFGEMPPKQYRASYLAKVKKMGFDTLEVPATRTTTTPRSTRRSFGRRSRAPGWPSAASAPAGR